MNNTAYHFEIISSKKKLQYSAGSAVLLMITLFFVTISIPEAVHVSIFPTILLYIFVSTIGLQQCNYTYYKLQDYNLRRLGYLWLIKLMLTLFLLYVAWMPELELTNAVSWGYDPQRYYLCATELLEIGKHITCEGLNYHGIVFYYAGIFYLFGQNPIIPALINAFVTLLATLYLIRVLYEFKEERSSRDWVVIFLLLIPDIVWYDVMTSRETLVLALLLLATLPFGRYFAKSKNASLLRTIVFSGFGLLGIILIRPTMLISAVTSIILMSHLIRHGRRKNILYSFMLIGLAGGLFLTKFYFGEVLNDSTGSYATIVQSLVNPVGLDDSGLTWSDNSIGMLLIPHNIWQFLVFIPPRMLLYLVTPLPYIGVSFSDLWNGSWQGWQNLMSIMTSLLNIIVFPFVMAGSWSAFGQLKQKPGLSVLYLIFWVCFIFICAGNLIIHERYRIMMTLQLFGCAWLGYTTCKRYQLKLSALIFYCVLLFGGIFYLVYKQLL